MTDSSPPGGAHPGDPVVPGACRRAAGSVGGLLIIVAAVVGLHRMFSVIVDYSTDIVGVLLLVAAAYVGWTTIKEALSSR